MKPRKNRSLFTRELAGVFIFQVTHVNVGTEQLEPVIPLQDFIPEIGSFLTLWIEWISLAAIFARTGRALIERLKDGTGTFELCSHKDNVFIDGKIY